MCWSAPGKTGLCIELLYFTYVWTQKWILGKSAKRGTAGMREETVGVHLTELEQRTERDRHAGREKQEKGVLH